MELALRTSVGTAGDLRKDPEPGSWRTGTEEVGGCPGSKVGARKSSQSFSGRELADGACKSSS